MAALSEGITKAEPRKLEIVYASVFRFLYLHLAALYGLYLCFTSAKWATILFEYVIFLCASIGVSAGAHRLWSHKAYKAKLPLQIILMVLNTFAFLNTAANWIRDHRLHHKFSDTDADPYNNSRGFFFAHIGWLMVKKHKEVEKMGKMIDFSDIDNNKVLQFQKKYALPFVGLLCFILPTVIPMYFWGETLSNAWHICLFRYALNIHVVSAVNSVAHRWGNKPYDTTILPSDNKGITVVSIGEGFHNFHHVFPWDYRSSELGYSYMNFTTAFIDFFAWIGWAYDLKAASKEMIHARCARTGNKKITESDKEIENSDKVYETKPWTWDDTETPVDDNMSSANEKSDLKKEVTQRKILLPQRA